MGVVPSLQLQDSHKFWCDQGMVWWIFLPWGCSRPNWMGPWTTWSGGDKQHIASAWGWISLKVSSNLSHSTIQWLMSLFTGAFGLFISISIQHLFPHFLTVFSLVLRPNCTQKQRCYREPLMLCIGLGSSEHRGLCSHWYLVTEIPVPGPIEWKYGLVKADTH